MKWCAAVDRAVEPLGLTHAQYAVVATLLDMQRTGEFPSQRELADKAGLEPIYISKLARALERGGMISRSSHPRDTRAVQLTLTDRGEEIARRAVTVVDELQERLAAPLGGTHSERIGSFVNDLEVLLAGTRTSGAHASAGNGRRER
jgi:MarR family transcriptional regulator, organic hydroperoxide resistance regulator